MKGWQAAKTHCKRGHPLSGENLYRYRGERQCKTCRRMHARRHDKECRALPSEQKLRAVFSALREGKTLSVITTGLVHAGGSNYQKVATAIVNGNSLRRLMQTNAPAGRLIRKLAEENRVAQHKARWLQRPRVARVSERGYEAIRRATEGLPDHLRDDVRSEMFLAIAEGRLPLREAAARVSEFVTAHNRTFSKFMPGGGLLLSLDQPAYADETGTRLVDTVSTGLWS